jgi:hypothetical protein
MSQLPNAFYNPTASPVSTSVVPFVQPPQPVQVEMGGGIQNLGAAFSGFSQTLASFVANQVSQNRADAIKEGELKALKSRKSFQQMVASNEINPIENPWEALGAAGADGQLKAHAALSKWQAEYQSKMESDPNFASSMGSFESFINERISNEMASGLDNPVWQRSFLQEVNPRVSYMAENHGQNVVKYRREKMIQGFDSSVMASVTDIQSARKSAKDDTQLQTEASKIFDGLQSKYTELYQTLGSDIANKAMSTSIVKALVASGDDPLIRQWASTVKSGTGKLIDTAETKAALASSAELIRKSREQHDLDSLSKFAAESLRANERLPSKEEFIKHALKMRPDMPSDDQEQYYAAMLKSFESSSKELFTAKTNAMMTTAASNMVSAYSPDKNGELPNTPEAQSWRNPVAAKALIKQNVLALQQRMGMPINVKDIESRVNDLYDLAKFEGSQRVAQAYSAMPKNDPRRAAYIVGWASMSGTAVAEAPMINESVSLFKASPSVDRYSPDLEYGVNMYRQFKLQGDGAMEKAGFHKEVVRFFERMDQNSMGGRSPEAAAMNAAAETSAPVDRFSQAERDLIGASARGAVKGWFEWVPGVTSTEQAGSILSLAAQAEFAIKGQHMDAETLKLSTSNWVKNHSFVLSNGAPFIYPDSLRTEARSSNAVSMVTDQLTQSLKKANPSVDHAYLQWSPATNTYMVLATSNGRPFSDAQPLDDKMISQLNKDGLSMVYTPDSFANFVLKSSIKQNERDTEFKKRMWQSYSEGLRAGPPV